MWMRFVFKTPHDKTITFLTTTSYSFCSIKVIKLSYQFKSSETHCVKSFRIRSCSGPHFPTFGVNSVFHSNSGNYGPEKLRILTLFTQGHLSIFMVFADWHHQTYLEVAFSSWRRIPYGRVSAFIFLRFLNHSIYLFHYDWPVAPQTEVNNLQHNHLNNQGWNTLQKELTASIQLLNRFLNIPLNCACWRCVIAEDVL